MSVSSHFLPFWLQISTDVTKPWVPGTRTRLPVFGTRGSTRAFVQWAGWAATGHKRQTESRWPLTFCLRFSSAGSEVGRAAGVGYVSWEDLKWNLRPSRFLVFNVNNHLLFCEKKKTNKFYRAVNRLVFDPFLLLRKLRLHIKCNSRFDWFQWFPLINWSLLIVIDQSHIVEANVAVTCSNISSASAR